MNTEFKKEDCCNDAAFNMSSYYDSTIKCCKCKIGPTGPTGSGIIEAFATATVRNKSIDIIPAGTNIGTSGFGATLAVGPGLNISGTDITLTNAGFYLISFSVNITTPTIAGVRVVINGISNINILTLEPTSAKTSWNLTQIVQINSGDQLSLQFYGVTATVQIVSDSVGANMTLVKLL